MKIRMVWQSLKNKKIGYTKWVDKQAYYSMYKGWVMMLNAQYYNHLHHWIEERENDVRFRS